MLPESKRLMLFGSNPDTHIHWAGDEAYITAKKSIRSSVIDVAFLGDSITYGSGATEGSEDTLGFVGLLRTAMQSKYGNSGRGLLPAYRTDWLTYAGAGWGDPSWGIASGIRSNSIAGAGDTMTCVVYGDSIDFYVIDNNFAAFPITVDGGDPVNIGHTAPLNEYKYTVPMGAVRNHTVVLTVTEDLYFDAVSVKIGATGMRIHGIGRIGTQIASFYGGAFTQKWEAVLAPKLWVIMLTVNDYAEQTALNTYQTALEGLVDLCTPTGSVLMVASAQPNTALTIPHSDYVARCQTVATAKGCGFLDISSLWGSWAQANAKGYMAGAVHPSNAGHAEIARLLLPYL